MLCDGFAADCDHRRDAITTSLTSDPECEKANCHRLRYMPKPPAIELALFSLRPSCFGWDSNTLFPVDVILPVHLMQRLSIPDLDNADNVWCCLLLKTSQPHHQLGKLMVFHHTGMPVKGQKIPSSWPRWPWKAFEIINCLDDGAFRRAAYDGWRERLAREAVLLL